MVTAYVSPDVTFGSAYSLVRAQTTAVARGACSVGPKRETHRSQLLGLALPSLASLDLVGKQESSLCGFFGGPRCYSSRSSGWLQRNTDPVWLRFWGNSRHHNVPCKLWCTRSVCNPCKTFLIHARCICAAGTSKQKLTAETTHPRTAHGHTVFIIVPFQTSSAERTSSYSPNQLLSSSAHTSLKRKGILPSFVA